MARGAQLAAALDLDGEAAVGFRCGDRCGLAIVDGLQEAGLEAAVLEKLATPAGDGEMRHVGVDVDAGHQAAGEAEALRHGIVVDLVLRGVRRVVGDDGVGFELDAHVCPSLVSGSRPLERL